MAGNSQPVIYRPPMRKLDTFISADRAIPRGVSARMPGLASES
jgi:hypothetical protein